MKAENRGLLSYLRSWGAVKKAQARILVLGLDNAGKTTLLKALSNESIEMVQPTFGYNIKSLTHERLKLNVWDVGGQRVLREYWQNYFPNTDGLVFVIDSSDKRRVKQAGMQVRSLLIQKHLSGVPLLIFANKQDMNSALQPNELLDLMELGKIATRKWTVVACSAKTSEGLEQGFQWLIDQIKV